MEKRNADPLAHLQEVVFPDLIPEERIITSFHPWHVFRYQFLTQRREKPLDLAL